ncbi:MAG TPA: tetraacyldisaccharide 4'-kinase [Gemmatimonadaceae bacterium]|nr:tetraacyldisaccharide 4'-kinase [Gemmatimonadaceae bacterium]
MDGIDRLWYARDPLARSARVALAPFGLAWRGAMSLRNALYDRGLLPVQAAPLPAAAVGNLAVGGAGKTPVAAWLAGMLLDRGARPAVVLRGYGDDEPRVHALLNPGAMVVVDADRTRGMHRARAAGCDVALLDDAFQHRRAGRMEDVVLVSADRWHEDRRPLPAGPWRESLTALRRASLLLVTRKAVASTVAAELLARLKGMTPGGAGCCVALQIAGLHTVTGERAASLDTLRNRRVLAISGIADPAAFRAQLAAVGARVEAAAFGDHYRFGPSDAQRLAARAEAADLAVCTLKDAVKLRELWPREARPLWYVSLRCEAEPDDGAVDALIDRLLAARHQPTPGPTG